MGNASEVMRDSAKVCGVCVRQKTVESCGIGLIVLFVKSVRFVVKQKQLLVIMTKQNY